MTRDYTFTNVTANHTIVASFEENMPETYIITASVTGENGTIDPNLTCDDLYLKRSRSTTISVAIYNSVGALVYTFETSNELHKIDVSKFSPGLYMIILIENNTHTTKKFIKQ